MANIVERHRFYDNGNSKREKENFQGYSFENIDSRKLQTPISFTRSDFRGANIKGSYFKRNNFSNADFIDTVITNSTFDDCIFRYTEFYNTYFENIEIKNLVFDSSSFVRIVFKSCQFDSTKMKANTLRDCKFIDCKILKSDFEKSSMDEVEYENVSFEDVDLSAMTSMNLYFNNCQFKNVIIDADYLGSYFFKGKIVEDLHLKYRGKVLKLDITKTDLLNSLFRILFENERYYEALNIVVQKNLLEGKKVSILKILKLIIDKLLLEANALKRSYQFEKLFKLLEYYLNTDYIIIYDYFKIIEYIDTIHSNNLSLRERLTIVEGNQRLKNLINILDLDFSFITNSTSDIKMLVEIAIDNKDEKLFEKLLSNLISKLTKCDSPEGMAYKIIAKRKGSIIYEIIIYTSLALAFLRLLKWGLIESRKILNESMQCAIDFKSNIKMFKLVDKAKTVRDIKSIKQVQILSDKAINSKSDDEDLKKISSIIKYGKWYPNAFTDRDG